MTLARGISVMCRRQLSDGRPIKTMLPVMLAVNTRPSPRTLTASITPVVMVNTRSSAVRRERDTTGDLHAPCHARPLASMRDARFTREVIVGFHAVLLERPHQPRGRVHTANVPPVIERAAPQQLARGTDFARRLACGVRMAWGHENRDHVELARTRVPAVPPRSRGVVVPRLERAPATRVDAVRGTSVRTGQLHTAAAAAGLTALLVLHLGAADAAGPASMTARALVVSDQARRYLGLAYGSSPTEFMGCMIGQVHGPVVCVPRIAPADVDPAHSTQTHVLPRQTCEQA